MSTVQPIILRERDTPEPYNAAEVCHNSPNQAHFTDMHAHVYNAYCIVRQWSVVKNKYGSFSFWPSNKNTQSLQFNELSEIHGFQGHTSQLEETIYWAMWEKKKKYNNSVQGVWKIVQ